MPSAPLVVKDDPTLMFTNAGMNQFKDYFLGNKQANQPRIADTQKCLRVSGKHNDLEEVGIDTYHHTMFEMLGNWSFGDYFKKEAIEWALELLTQVYHLPKKNMYVTVFGGDEQENLAADSEAYEYWKNILPEERILYGSKKDNFWEMGETGPCGPCSEIHIDLRPEEEIKKKPGRELVNADHPLVMEIWNLVFIQYNRKSDGGLSNLPDKHVDTGMGFERLVMAIQGKRSNYDTDVFQPLIKYLSKACGIQYGARKETDIAIRVVVDHVRAVAFTIADGQLPSNTGAGYVIRRILRRAVRYGFTYLNFKEPFIHHLIPVLAKQFSGVFPELDQQLEFVSKVIMEEEQSFLRTLENGIKIFEEAYRDAVNSDKTDGNPIISGEIAFKLYDTYGFPIDLTQLLARERNASVNMEEFQFWMAQQKNRSKAAAAQEKGDWVTLKENAGVKFVGYELLETDSSIVRYREIKDKKKTIYQVVLEQTPFYAESGGQVGDTGYIEADGDRIAVIDTQKENDLIIQFMEKLPSNPGAIFHCVVDKNKRHLTENNHSATHLLHAALRKVLGKHVQQKGSFVNDKILRFDFSHFAKVTDEELAEIEHIVNRKIRENIALDEKRNVPIEKAKSLGAMALFGEKYGDFVRVITFDAGYSIELCGGTHVPQTGRIGLMKIISESSVAAGVRRIEAITADRAESFIDENLKTLEQIKTLFNNPKDVLKMVEHVLEEKNALSKQIERFQIDQANQVKNQLVRQAKPHNGLTTIIEKVDLPSTDALKKISFDLKNQIDNLFMILAANIDNKPQIAIMISENVVDDYQLNASTLIRDLAKEIQGGGGGQPFFATAGGKELSGLENVVKRGSELIKSIKRN